MPPDHQLWERPKPSANLLDRSADDQRSLAEAMVPVRLADGSTRRVLDCGSGDAVVMMPMVTELNFVYSSQVADLQRDHRVVLYEPALSRTTRVPVVDRAGEAADVMDACRIDRAHVLTWGDTGSAAYALARDRPDRCQSLILIGLADRYAFDQPYATLLRLLERTPIEGLVPARLIAALIGHFVAGRQVKAEWFVERAVAIPQLGALFKHSIIPNLTDHRPIAGEVDVPALVVGGDHDAIVTVSQSQAMAALLSGAGEAVIVPGGEHFVSYVDDRVVNAAIREFLAEPEVTSEAR